MSQHSPEVMAAFERHERELGLRRLRLGCIIAMALTPAGIIIDWVLLAPPKGPVRPEETNSLLELFLIRVICSVAILPILALSRTPFGARYFRQLGVLLSLAPAACMALIISMTNGKYHGVDSPYYAGLNMVLLGIGMVMQWTAAQSLAAVGLVFGLYFAAVYESPFGTRPGSGGYELLMSNLWFLSLTSIIVVIGSRISYGLRLSDFVSRFDLDRSRRELENTNQRLRELDEVKGRFFANISHELRTPLTLLLGPLEQLSHHPQIVSDARLRDYLDTMHNNGLRLLKLINDLLDLVRLDSGRLKLNRVRVDVQSFGHGLMNAVRRFAEDRGLRVICDIDPRLTYVAADPDKLEKVLLNLLFNSIKFTPAGGQVRLRGVREGEVAVFEVTDTGVGIDAANLPNLFKRFWQADSSAHRKHQGAGIGLALVKELVEAHGGTVEAKSRVGHGTTMTVRLPLGSESSLAATPVAPLAPPPRAEVVPPGAGSLDSAGEGRAPEAAGSVAGSPGEAQGSANGDWAKPAKEPEDMAALYRRAERFASITPLRESLRPWNPGRGGARPVVLVVDDEPDMLRFLRTQVEDDYDVREAVDGNQATVLAAQYLPDAILCDMMLPEKDGMQVCRELRQNHSTRSLPFLMLTARADDDTKLAALAAGASDFLPKPFSSAELKLRLKNLVDAQRLQKELARQNRQLEATLEELRETELQLVQSEKMASLGRLSAGIIHEINNPLNFARTGLHVLGRHGTKLPSELREEYEEVLRDIGEGIARVATIVGDLRRFSHPENDVLEDVDVEETAEAALRFLAAEWKEGRVEITKDIPDAFFVRANRNKLVQVMLNICQNAFDAMRTNPKPDEPARMLIRAWSENGRRKVGLRDNGPGIPEHHLARIFEPFYTTKEVGKGMGLGLSICYRIIEEAGGRITVNTEPGQFCEFVLDFPDRATDKTEPKN